MWAAFWTLLSARSFYGALGEQTGGEWSAPLDDVFIHFDYAKATALGHPFEWVAGNGYSSGNTSLTYPFVLALGWLGGFRDLALMKWAAWVACVSVFAVFVALGRTLPRLAAYVAVPLVVGVGALAWSLWSGMEVAFFLAIWAGAFVAWSDLAKDAAHRRGWWLLGAWCALLVVTRPEAIAGVAAFALLPRTPFARTIKWTKRIGLMARAVVPAIALLVLQAIANRVLTGESSANGAIVKLAMNSPYLSWPEKIADWRFNLRYSVFRCIEYHFADRNYVGQLIPLLAIVPLAFRPLRRLAVLLWLTLLGWIVLVALNGQVRWQNERYLMPAVAWLLILAGIGAAAFLETIPALFDRARRAALPRPSAWTWFLVGAASMQLLAVAFRPSGTEPDFGIPFSFSHAESPAMLVLRSSYLWSIVLGAALVFLFRFAAARAAFAAIALTVFTIHQLPKMRDQMWFFGRASRNIRDQHVTAGRWIETSGAHRVLVGDAGALMYISGKPGLDIIGLGGYHGLPFARAGVHGLAASIELIERMPPAERPDLFAIYPSWWGNLTTWFTKREVIRFPAPGNVICGGADDVLFEADWHVLNSGDMPKTAFAAGEQIVDEVDVADLVSEKKHRYAFSHPGDGWTDMRILEDGSGVAGAELFDGGRRFAAGGGFESFRVGGLKPGQAAKVILRTAPEAREIVDLRVNGASIATVDVPAGSAWTERTIVLPADRVTESADIELKNIGENEWVDYHVWIVQ